MQTMKPKAAWGLGFVGLVAAVVMATPDKQSSPAPDAVAETAFSPASLVTTTTSEPAPAVESSADDGTILGGETYSAYDARRDALDGSAGYSHGDGCTEDCGGHDAGYQWAEDNAVTDASECGGKSWSFREGCVAYAEEQASERAGDAEQ